MENKELSSFILHDMKHTHAQVTASQLVLYLKKFLYKACFCLLVSSKLKSDNKTPRLNLFQTLTLTSFVFKTYYLYLTTKNQIDV